MSSVGNIKLERVLSVQLALLDLNYIYLCLNLTNASIGTLAKQDVAE